MFEKFDLSVFLLAILPVLLAISVRAAVRAYVARYHGDPTAEQMGRLTLNPLVHIDLVGTIIVPILMFLFTNFLVGWAKPVPIISSNFRNPRLAWRYISLSGPLANFVMALAWGAIFSLSTYAGDFATSLARMAEYGVAVNVILFAISLIPLLPYDGGRIIDTFLSAKWSLKFQKTEPYSPWIVLLLLLSGLLGKVLSPLIGLIVLVVDAFTSLF